MKKRAARPLADRFWEKVNKTHTCWLWTGSKNRLGYGCIWSGDGEKRLLRATAAAWLVVRGEHVPKGIDLCHVCDNPPCVNPDHLFLGTAKENIRDAIQKGRFKFPKPRPGEANNKAKLTWQLAADIRSAYAAGETLSQLSRRLGMARSTLREVVNGRNWRIPGVQSNPRKTPTSAKLTTEDRLNIAAQFSRGIPWQDIATRYGVHQCTVHRIVKRTAEQYRFVPIQTTEAGLF